MNKSTLKSLIKECIAEVKTKKAIRPIILEMIEEIKDEYNKSTAETLETLNSLVSKINDSYSFEKDDAGNLTLCNCSPNHVSVRPKYKNSFDVEYFKDGSDREKKLNLTIEDLKTYISDKLKSKDKNYVQSAHTKASENSEDKELKSGESKIKRVGEKATDAVKNEVDLPDKPMREIPLDKQKKQVDHKSEKSDYKYPEQSKKDKNHVTKFKGKSLK